MQENEVLTLHSELLTIRSSLVRHEELHMQVRDTLQELRKLAEDHEGRLRILERAHARADGALAMSRTLMAVYAAFASGIASIVLFLLQRLLGG